MTTIKFLSVLTLVTSLVSATPILKRDSAITDPQVLNFALTLEHLENAFYRDGLAKFDANAFTDAGLPAFSRGRFNQIAEHEATHVAFLQTALGDAATKPCNYSFPYTDPVSFAALSSILEGVGDSAYLGAAKLVSDKGTLTAAASILSTEARHQSWVSGAINKQQPWSGAFDTPLSLNQVYSLAAPFIVACPSTNPDLGVKAFPTLAVDPAAPTAGSEITLNYTNTWGNGPTFLALLTGLDTKFVPVTDNKATLPEGLQGTVYAVLSSNGTVVSDEATLAGPAIVILPFNSHADNAQ